jgi:hypothetical protein
VFTMLKQTKPYATQIPRSVWKQHKETIETLFFYEDKTLSDVMGAMKRRGFYARSVAPPKNFLCTARISVDVYTVNLSTSANSRCGIYERTGRRGTGLKQPVSLRR